MFQQRVQEWQTQDLLRQNDRRSELQKHHADR